MSNFLLMVSLAIYSYQYFKLRKKVQDLEDLIDCCDGEFWKDKCDEKI